MKLRPETQAFIFLSVWEAFLFLALFSSTKTGWYLFLVDSIIQGLMLVYDSKLDKTETALRHTRYRLSRLSSEYINYLQDHATVFEVTTNTNGRKTKKIHRKVS